MLGARSEADFLRENDPLTELHLRQDRAGLAGGLGDVGGNTKHAMLVDF